MSDAPPRASGPIVVDLQALQSPMSRGRGIGRYALSWAQALESHDPSLVGRYLLNPALPPPGHLEDLLNLGKVAYLDEPGAIPQGARLFHALSPFDPHVRAAEIWPAPAVRRGLGLSVTVYDLIPALDPDQALADPAERRRYRLRLELLRHADAVLVLSRAVASQLESEVGLAPERVHNVGAVPDARFVPPRSRVEALAAAERALAPAGLSGPYVLYPSGSHPRKNNEGLIRAYAALPEDLRAAYQLVIAGDLGASTAHHCHYLAERLGAPGRVITPGFVDDDTLVTLYQGAALVCFCSLAEGFGLPIVEAQACATPVIASSRPPMDELVDPGDRFDPSDDAAMTAALARSLRAPRPVGSPRRSGGWEAVAQASVEAFADALGRPRRRVAQSSPRRRRPRLAMVTPLPPAPSGVAGYSYRLLEALAKTEKLEIDVFADGPPPWHAPQGLTVTNVAALGRIEALTGPYDHVLYTLGNSHHHLGALAALRNRRGSVLAHDVRLTNLYRHEHGDPGLLPGGFGRALHQMYGDELPEGLGRSGQVSPAELSQFGLLMAREAIGCAELFLVSSTAAATLARLDAGGVGGRVAVLPFAMEAPPPDTGFVEEIRPAPPLLNSAAGRWGTLPSSSSRPLVAHFGIVDPVKLPILLLEAVSILALEGLEVDLAFVGPISDLLAGELVANAEAQGIAGRLTLTGPLDASAYRSWAERASVAVQLRAAFSGEASAAVGECLALGVATVVSDLGWLGELPDDAVAKVAPGASAADLAGLLSSLLADPARRRSMAEHGRRVAELHSFDATARALLVLLEQARRHEPQLQLR